VTGDEKVADWDSQSQECDCTCTDMEFMPPMCATSRLVSVIDWQWWSAHAMNASWKTLIRVTSCHASAGIVRLRKCIHEAGFSGRFDAAVSFSSPNTMLDFCCVIGCQCHWWPLMSFGTCQRFSVVDRDYKLLFTRRGVYYSLNAYKLRDRCGRAGSCRRSVFLGFTP